MSQETDDLGLNVGMLTVLDMFSQDQKCILPLVGTDRHDCVDHRLSESYVAVFLETIR